MSISSTGLSDYERRGRGGHIKPLVVSPREACRMLGCGLTRLYEILPELESYLDGKVRRITVDSIEQRVARKLAEARAGENATT